MTKYRNLLGENLHISQTAKSLKMANVPVYFYSGYLSSETDEKRLFFKCLLLELKSQAAPNGLQEYELL